METGETYHNRLRYLPGNCAYQAAEKTGVRGDVCPRRGVGRSPTSLIIYELF